MPAVFADEVIHPQIMGLHGNGCDDLVGEADADEQLAGFALLEKAIVVATAFAEPRTIAPEGLRRAESDIDFD